VATIDEDLSQLEKDIRQLQIEYDTYFTGGRPRPPTSTEWRVQRGIKHFPEIGGRLKYAERFRFNTLAARYAKFSEVWRQRARRVEAGHSAFGYSRVARQLEQQRLAEFEQRHQARALTAQARVAVSDPVREAENMQTLYHAMVEAKTQAGEKAEVNFEQFNKFVRRKTAQLRKQMGYKKVDYEVSVDKGKVKLKAKAL
jgi:hypothetical protein